MITIAGYEIRAPVHRSHLRSIYSAVRVEDSLPVIIKTLHEFGHAYFCRKFGGEVHVMGVMLMIFTPAPYMDATSSWAFRNRWKRVLVGAAGMIVEIFFAAFATFVWAKTGPGTIHNLAYNMMFIASISTVVFNINPLLRFDGYYILSDLVDIPNLHQRAQQQLRYFAERYLFGLKKVESPANNPREGFWLCVFGIASGIYRVVVFGGVLLVIADRFLLLGIIMAAVCFISWVTVPTVRFVQYLASSPKLERQRKRAIALSGALAASRTGKRVWRREGTAHGYGFRKCVSPVWASTPQHKAFVSAGVLCRPFRQTPPL